MICDKIFYMTFNDLRKNAYKSSVSQNVAQKKIQVLKEDLSSQKEKSKKEKHKSQNPELNAASDALVSGGLLKVHVSKKEADGRDSVYRRVAKFLLIIGVDEAAKILPHLTEEQTEKIIPEIASIRSVSPEETRQILEEFETLLKNAREGGGIDTAREILKKAYGEKKAKELIDKSVPFPLEKPFEYLNDIDNERINLLLKEESVQVKALILSHLNPKKAASVINLMDSKEKSEVAFRLLKLEPVSPEVIKNLDEVLHKKVLLQNSQRTNSLDGKKILAEILKKMSFSTENSILSKISTEEPSLANDLRERLFTVDDVVSSDDRFVQEILMMYSNYEIACLVYKREEKFTKKIFQCISQGRVSQVQEELNINQTFLKSECDKIYSKFLNTLRNAFEEGKLFIKNRTDDVYI
ncbi:MAG: flagellar motor switch protein FliG [Spirochaetia bacterium]|nr:flagellar motor switch protein FliG [Spirochaetia bacterium]